MERHGTLPSKPEQSDPENVKVIEWEDFDQDLARLWSLSAALKDANDKKQILKQKLEALIQRAAIWWAGQCRVIESIE